MLSRFSMVVRLERVYQTPSSGVENVSFVGVNVIEGHSRSRDLWGKEVVEGYFRELESKIDGKFKEEFGAEALKWIRAIEAGEEAPRAGGDDPPQASPLVRPEQSGTSLPLPG